jgi:hypothetical protein
MTCPTCGKLLDEGASKCQMCSPVLKVGSDCLDLKVNPVGILVATPPGHPGGSRVDYRPPSGGQALSEADPEGAFTAKLSKGLVSGRKNEPYAVSGLVAVLKAEGRDVQLVSGARDEDGEDQIILIDGERLIVQVVTMPAEDTVWQPLNTVGTFTETGDREKAVEWVRSALFKKRAAKGAIVVLDAHHFGALVGRDLVKAYRVVHPKPVNEFGFKDAWIIGPIPPFSARIA